MGKLARRTGIRPPGTPRTPLFSCESPECDRRAPLDARWTHVLIEVPDRNRAIRLRFCDHICHAAWAAAEPIARTKLTDDRWIDSTAV